MSCLRTRRRGEHVENPWLNIGGSGVGGKMITESRWRARRGRSKRKPCGEYSQLLLSASNKRWVERRAAGIGPTVYIYRLKSSFPISSFSPYSLARFLHDKVQNLLFHSFFLARELSLLYARR